MLHPKKVKFRKTQKGRIKGMAQRGNSVVFGSYGIKAVQPAFLTDRQIEAVRITISRILSKIGKMWIRVFPDKPITRKPEGRMGKGKGNPEFWAAVIRPGRVLFEMDGISIEAAKQAVELASHKLPMKVKFVSHKDCVSL